MNEFGHHYHLLGRYPEVAESDMFIDWEANHHPERWHETRPNEKGELDVVVQSDDGTSVYSAKLQRMVRKDANEQELVHQLIREHVFSPADMVTSPNLLLTSIMTKESEQEPEIVAIRPMVDLAVESPTFKWEIETYEHHLIKTYTFDDSADSLQYKIIERLPHLSGEDKENGAFRREPNDWLASDECHHLARWRSTAKEMIRDKSTAEDKAKEIFYAVREKMSYDGTIKHISNFTHSDNLVMSKYGWKGICDELAVAQITLLRAVGIPATLKFMSGRFPRNGGESYERSAHAFLEWYDGKRWRHMDALWDAFDNRERYRERGVKSVKLMDASYPRDRRSTAPAWGAEDVTGDGKFHPYRDFVLSPRYPGERRPDYSY